MFLCIYILVLLNLSRVLSSRWGTSNPKNRNSVQVLINGAITNLEYGSSSLQLTHKICVPLNLTAGECEEMVDDFFGAWYNMDYAPSTHGQNWENEYLSTRGTVVSILQDLYGYTRYLEIGTDVDSLFSAARMMFPYAVGVDPNNGGTLRMTSDAFFTSNTEKFDLIFIDGLHEAHQVFRDVMNALQILSPGGTILMHDCNPRGDLDVRATFPKHPFAVGWNGDTWKAAVALRLLPDIEIVVVDVDHGVGVVRRRPNRQPVSEHWQARLGRGPISVLTNDDFRRSKLELIRLVSLDGLVDWLTSE